MNPSVASTRFRRVLPWAAFLAVLVVATFFVGDTGVYNDDYFLNQRDPVTGEIGPLIMNRPWHLWRPMTRHVLPPIITTLWNHPWALHAISALLHAAVVALAYGLMRRFRVRAAIAGPCAMAFMVYPVHFEAVLWSSIICTLMSVVLVLGIWHAYAWWLTEKKPLSGALRLLLLLALGLLAWCAAAFNEQPPGALAALPLAVMVLGLADGPTLAQRLRRSAMPVVAVAVGLGVYLVGFFRHQLARPHPDVTKHPRLSLPERIEDLCHKIPDDMALREFGKGAFTEGLRAIESHPVTAVVAVIVLATLSLMWTLLPRSDDSPSDRPSRQALMWLTVLGLAWMVAAWIPVVAAHSITSSRLYYVPAMGCAIALAGAASLWAQTRAARPPKPSLAVHVLSRLAFSALIGVALVMWIGVQANLKHRCDLDRTEIRPIVEALGPTIEPDTFLVPVRIDSRAVSTGSERFDDYFQPCWYWEFAAGWRAQMALKSQRVYTFQTGPGVGESLWVSPTDPLHFGIIRAKATRPKPDNITSLLIQYKTEGRQISWDHAVFFETPEAGVTRLFTRLRLHIPGAAPVEIIPRQIAIARPATPLPEHVLDVYPITTARTREAVPTTNTNPGTGSAQPPR